MRPVCFAIALCSFLLASFALADEPAKGMKRHPVGSTMTIDLPKSWKFASYPMPIPGASNYRVDTGPMRFAITGIEASAMVEPGETPPTLSLDPAEVKSVIVEGSAQYFPQSVEKSVDPIVVSGPGFIGAYATYHSADGKPSFMAFVGRTYACVTSATVRTTSSVLAITIGSDDCDGADHCAAVASLSALQVVGGSAAAAAPVAAAPVAAAPGAGAVSDADLNAIVAATLTHKDVAMYLHPEVKGRVPVRVAFSPPHDGRKVNINLYDKPVETVTDASKRASAVNLSLECQEAACKVSVSYRPEGIHGYVKLKSLDGKWEVEEASILE